MSVTYKVLVLISAALIGNLPLGYLREGTRKFSFKWFLYIHISIPFIILLRMGMGLSYWFIPFSLGSAVMGQLIGGRYRRATARG